jgi:uncharacterized FlaG/YvyC family protein
MSDTDNGEKIEVPQNTREAAPLRFHFENIELLDRNSLYGLNPELFACGIPVFKLPLSPYIYRKSNKIIPCLLSPSLDPYYKQTRLIREEINRNLLLANKNLRNAGSGLTMREYNDRIAPIGFTVIKFFKKADNTVVASFLPDVTDALLVPVIPPAVTFEQHAERNKYQNGFAPRSLKTMKILVRCDFFELYTKDDKDGYTRTHNLTESQNTQTGRQEVFYRGTQKKDNLDYRGAVNDGMGNKFKGMQFVYHEKSEELVVDVVNKGTYDYVSPKDDFIKHFVYDVASWIEWGNVEEDDVRIYMPDEREKEILALNERFPGKDKITDVGVKKRIYDLFPQKERPIL